MLALTVGDVDLATREISINKSVLREAARVTISRPKTAKARRRIPITLATAEKLAPLIAGKRPEEYLFASPDGRPMVRILFNEHHWKPLRKAAGLEGFQFHDLRHTMATVLLLANVHPKIVAERLGHARIEITLNTYSHLLPTMQISVLAPIEGFLVAVPLQ